MTRLILTSSFIVRFIACASSALLIAACGGSESNSNSESEAESKDAPCDAVSKCTGNPRGAETIARCEQEQNHPACGQLHRAVWNCQVENQVCGADGKTDLEAMKEICLHEIGEWEWCRLEGG